ncbi:hypothetical protein [Pseudomonas extremaustralis]|uniref:Uncharacterized protein n=1 Tax=Pseudomonas extremaustralis TaxID=359110 RepID=A0ABY0NB87_9PSED|nr:hypothetical protein [Pseudomonas extremaustralis]SDF03819.1 hypothetical protein SAMN05216591_1774 [Pseudomonas extremaustralis]
MKSKHWKQIVNAGLPAMQTPLCIRYTAPMLSLESQFLRGLR